MKSDAIAIYEGSSRESLVEPRCSVKLSCRITYRLPQTTALVQVLQNITGMSADRWLSKSAPFTPCFMTYLNWPVSTLRNVRLHKFVRPPPPPPPLQSWLRLYTSKKHKTRRKNRFTYARLTIQVLYSFMLCRWVNTSRRFEEWRHCDVSKRRNYIPNETAWHSKNTRIFSNIGVRTSNLALY